MIALPRREAARFRAALRRCVVGRPRGFAPPVACQQTKDCLTLSAILDEAALSLSLPAIERSAARMVVPFAILEAIVNSRTDVALLEDGADGRVRCRWQEGNEPKEIEETLVTPVSPFPKLPVPDRRSQRCSSLFTLAVGPQPVNRPIDLGSRVCNSVAKTDKSSAPMVASCSSGAAFNFRLPSRSWCQQSRFSVDENLWTLAMSGSPERPGMSWSPLDRGRCG